MVRVMMPSQRLASFTFLRQKQLAGRNGTFQHYLPVDTAGLAIRTSVHNMLCLASGGMDTMQHNGIGSTVGAADLALRPSKHKTRF